MVFSTWKSKYPRTMIRNLPQRQMAPISKSRYSSRSQFLFYLLSGETTQLWLLCQKKPPKLKQGSCVSIWNIATLDPKNLPPSNPPIPCIPPLQLGPSIIWIKGQFQHCLLTCWMLILSVLRLWLIGWRLLPAEQAWLYIKAFEKGAGHYASCNY